MPARIQREVGVGVGFCNDASNVRLLKHEENFLTMYEGK
jgi:hypothetical protein